MRLSKRIRVMPNRKHRSYLPIAVRSLLALTCFVAMLAALFRQERHTNQLRQVLIDDLSLDGFYTHTGGDYDWPLHSRWLHQLFGDYPASLGDVVFGPQATIDDRTISKLCEFPEIRCLVFDGEVYLNDEDIAKLEVLRNLEELNLSNADVSETSVRQLREALPQCRVVWNPVQR